MMIVPTTDGFLKLRAAINGPELPMIDFDVVVERIIDAVSHKPTISNELEQMREDMLRGEFLTSRSASSKPGSAFDMLEDPTDEYLPLETIASLSVKLGYEISKTFDQLKLYSGGFLGYEYRETLHDQSLVCRRRRDAF